MTKPGLKPTGLPAKPTLLSAMVDYHSHATSTYGRSDRLSHLPTVTQLMSCGPAVPFIICALEHHMAPPPQMPTAAQELGSDIQNLHGYCLRMHEVR